MRKCSDVTPNKSRLPEDSKKKKTNGTAQPTVSFRTSWEIIVPLSSLPSAAAEHLPILSLFDNAILTTDGLNNGLDDSISREFNTGSRRPPSYESSPHFRKSRIKRIKICEALTDFLPIHRPPSQAPNASSLHSQHRENVWWHLVQCDAYISLMLGLPSFMVPLLEPQTDLSAAVGVTSSEDYRRKLAILVGRIIQRNQVVPSQLPPRYEPQFKLMMNSTRSQPIWNLFRGIPLHHHWISASKMPS